MAVCDYLTSARRMVGQASDCRSERSSGFFPPCLLERHAGDAVPRLAAGLVHSPKLKVLIAVREHARTAQRGHDGATGRDPVRTEPTDDVGGVIRAVELQCGDAGTRPGGIGQADLEAP